MLALSGMWVDESNLTVKTGAANRLSARNLLPGSPFFGIQPLVPFFSAFSTGTIDGGPIPHFRVDPDFNHFPTLQGVCIDESSFA